MMTGLKRPKGPYRLTRRRQRAGGGTKLAGGNLEGRWQAAAGSWQRAEDRRTQETQQQRAGGRR